jgi:hypothetical protein
MSEKFSQLPSSTNLTNYTNVIFPIVDLSGPTSYTTPLSALSAQILTGNAASATKLATARTINGVSFDGTANIVITTSIAAATTSTIGGVIPDGTVITVDGSGHITVPDATSSAFGVVKPDNSTITVSAGVISATLQQSTVIHAFNYDVNNNLIYTQTTGTTFNYTSDGGNSSYLLVDIGTNIYSYSLDSNGNLIATFSS